jgi:hypothetical protein
MGLKASATFKVLKGERRTLFMDALAKDSDYEDLLGSNLDELRHAVKAVDEATKSARGPLPDAKVSVNTVVSLTVGNTHYDIAIHSLDENYALLRTSGGEVKTIFQTNPADANWMTQLVWESLEPMLDYVVSDGVRMSWARTLLQQVGVYANVCTAAGKKYQFLGNSDQRMTHLARVNHVICKCWFAPPWSKGRGYQLSEVKHHDDNICHMANPLVNQFSVATEETCGKEWFMRHTLDTALQWQAPPRRDDMTGDFWPFPDDYISADDLYRKYGHQARDALEAFELLAVHNLSHKQKRSNAECEAAYLYIQKGLEGTSKNHWNLLHTQTGEGGVARGQRRLCIPSTSWNAYALKIVHSVLRGIILDRDGFCIPFEEFYYLILHRCYRSPTRVVDSIISKGPSAGLHVIYEEFSLL